jgi:hypothetical protein
MKTQSTSPSIHQSQELAKIDDSTNREAKPKSGLFSENLILISLLGRASKGQLQGSDILFKEKLKKIFGPQG